MPNSNPNPNAQTFNINEVDDLSCLRWLNFGWQDMRKCLLPSLFYGFSFFLGGLLLIYSLAESPQYIPAVISGFLLSGPFLAIGIYELSRRLGNNEKATLAPTLFIWRKNAAAIGVFSLVLIVLFLVWARASLVVFAIFYSGKLPTMADMTKFVINTNQWDFLLTFFIVGGLFAAIAFAISVITIPMMLDREIDAITSAITSVRAVFANPTAMMFWAATIALLGMIGLVTFFVGIIFIGPLLGHATWHAYKDLVKPNQIEPDLSTF